MFVRALAWASGIFIVLIIFLQTEICVLCGGKNPIPLSLFFFFFFKLSLVSASVLSSFSKEQVQLSLLHSTTTTIAS